MRGNYFASLTDTVGAIVALACFQAVESGIPKRLEWPGVVDLSDLLIMMTENTSVLGQLWRFGYSIGYSRQRDVVGR